MDWSFKQINKLAHIIYEDEYIQHYHYPEMLTRYDSNFIEFKQMPTLKDFKRHEEALYKFHRKNNQLHLKFKFPSNEKISGDLIYYLKDKGYDIGFLELYVIEPSRFFVSKRQNIEVRFVTEAQLDEFLLLQYNQDVKYGENFAHEKQQLQRRQFHEEGIHFVIAYYEGNPAGYVELVEKDQTVEIDNLFVLEAFRHKGIGGQIQKSVMEKFHNKTVILVADGEDTARQMYQKQGYQYQGYQYEVVKVKKE
ncbi:GNAT family N-acetyltransferase [Lysinibacillus sp. BW-2-10]|uniref:GNAT family N-acetyltransferase n=1 Tax=Lysinibacillus sp. BW-2-10 TaxID=2590030 RepID=UPI00117C51E2|nr:GNAT family N-acetyltransferase [Lysinibacillus sp. BW-2-10]TSI11695.1 GNAT family N-acetyltransferase [Lysinibacillus sp. BW-2-10]